MLWFLLIVVSYILFAGSSLIDKYLLSGPLRHPSTYAFYAGVTGVVATIFLPFVDFRVPAKNIILLSFFVGFLGVVSIYFFFKSLSRGDVSIVIPIIGALTPIFTLILSYALAGNQISFTLKSFIALAFLISGSIFLSLQQGQKNKEARWHIFVYPALTAFLFALGWVLRKFVYDSEIFFNGFIWMGWGGFISSFIFFFSRDARKTITNKKTLTQKKITFPIVGSKVLASSAFFLQNYAVNIGSFNQVTFLQAMSGIQHFFVLLFAVLIYKKNPNILKEVFTKKIVAIRFLGIMLIAIGLWVMFR